MLDDVSALAWMGHDLRDVLRFWAGLRSLLKPVSGSTRPDQSASVLYSRLDSTAHFDVFFPMASLERPSSRFNVTRLLPPLELKKNRSIPTSFERCYKGPISGCRWNRSEVPARLQARCVTSFFSPPGRPAFAIHSVPHADRLTMTANRFRSTSRRRICPSLPLRSTLRAEL